ncbi:hypothetical protein [Pseudobutyrivibrio sp. MD2005]|uniref:hypothetical protein n=1 Tax=Pseudobutyrivibrio sp. MD2005 TaxID=1410616 RepID=UPI0004880DAA|nr:hypothetical protein [Pseudobutyrivibrio sp. MD2005]
MNIVKKIYKYPLEIILALLIILTIIFSSFCLIDSIPLSYGKSRLICNQSDVDPTNISDYLEKMSSDHTVIIVLKDTQPQFVTNEMIEHLKDVGFKDVGLLEENALHSYIGILSKGRIIYEQVGSDEMITFGDAIDKHYVVAQSGTYNDGYTGEIFIDTIQYAPNISGLNIVTVDLEDNELIDSVGYDVFAEDTPVYRLENDSLNQMKSSN